MNRVPQRYNDARFVGVTLRKRPRCSGRERDGVGMGEECVVSAGFFVDMVIVVVEENVVIMLYRGVDVWILGI